MTRNKIYRIILSGLLILIAALFIIGAIGIYGSGMAVREAGDALAWIYTPDLVAQKYAPIAPVLFLAIGFLIAGVLLGVRASDKKRLPGDAKYARYPKEIPARTTKVVRIVVLAAAVVLIVAGIFNGSMRDVLTKAIMICTECIGLG